MRDHIDYYDTLKMLGNARKNNSVAVIVESKSDEKFFKSFFDKDTIFFSVHGYSNVIEVLKKIENDDSLKFVIGIIDADFNRIINKTLDIRHTFMTDGHDLEMMKYKSEQAWKKIINHHTEENRIKFFESKNKVIRDLLLELSREVANIRFLSFEKNLSLKFKTLKDKGYDFIDYSKFIDEKTLSFNFEKMLETIENKSQKQNFFKSNPELKKELSNIRKNNYDLYEFCNGHDLMNILSIALKKVLGNKNISGQELEKDFTLAYELNDLEKTKLYESLKDWESKNSNIKLF